MWRHILAVILVSFCHLSYGQSMADSLIDILSKSKNISEIRSNTFLIKNDIIQNKFNKDSLDFNVIEYNDIFQKKRKSDLIKLSSPYYTIKMYAANDTMFFIVLFEKKFEDAMNTRMKSTKVFSYVDTLKTLDFISKHNLKYFGNWKLNDFIERMPEYGSFGLLCGGYVPRITDEAECLAELIRYDDKTKLKLLASSFYPEERAFGTLGLYILDIRKKNLSEDLKKLIEINRNSKINISTCYGCVDDSESMSEALDDRKMISMYKMLVYYQLIKK